MTFPFELGKAETLRALARDLGAPSKATIRREDMLHFFNLVLDQGLDEARTSFTPVTQDTPTAPPKRKRVTDTDESSSASKRTRQTAAQQSAHAYGTRNGGKRVTIVPSTSKKTSRTAPRKKPLVSRGSATPPPAESASTPSSPIRKSNRTPKKTEKASASAPASKAPFPGKKVQDEPVNHDKEILDGVVLVQRPSKPKSDSSSVSKNQDEVTDQDKPEDTSAVAEPAEADEPSEQDADGSKDENMSDKENMPAATVETEATVTDLPSTVPDTLPVFPVSTPAPSIPTTE